MSECFQGGGTQGSVINRVQGSRGYKLMCKNSLEFCQLHLYRLKLNASALQFKKGLLSK